MKNVINLIDAERTRIRFIDEKVAAESIRTYDKRWSFSFIYFLTELRDIYIALASFTRPKDSRNFEQKFTDFCLSIDLPFAKTPWKKRRIQEYLNALENFLIIDKHFQIKKRIFSNSEIGKPLSQDEIDTFHEIYFSYFRFKEIFSWFLKNPPDIDIDFIVNLRESSIYKDSKPIFFFSDKTRFTDNYIYKLEDNADIYFISEKDGELARFWDVFVSWGKKLNVLEKFSMRFPPVRPLLDVKKESSKHIYCCYIINNEVPTINLLEYLNIYYSSTYIYLPELVLNIAIKFRLRIETVQQIIIQQYKEHKDFLSFERTSEIFISTGKFKEDDRILFPKYNDAYISHLILRK